MRGETVEAHGLHRRVEISIHSPREGRDHGGDGKDQLWPISIHSPREGRDVDKQAIDAQRLVISIHSPREGRDFGATKYKKYSRNFNPLAP